MDMRKVLITAMAGCAFALGSGGTKAAPDACPTNGIIADWKAATGGTGVCQQGDKVWALGTTNLADTVRVLFSTIAVTTHVMQIIGFDASDAAGSWFLNYTITVTDPTASFISQVHTGADNPGGGSLLSKAVAGDPGGPFTLTVTDGTEGPTSEKHGLKGVTLTVAETFSANAGANLLSISNTYRDTLISATSIPTLSEWALVTTAFLLLAIGTLGLRGRR
jgi:hypothetical protein